MTSNYCTYFDRNYLFKGLALYRSLEKHCEEFLLYVLCMDRITYRILKKLPLKRIKLIKLADFEDPALLKVKPDRTAVEYYWTCTPSLPLYIFRKYQEQLITYIDADVMFFSSPQKIFEELGKKSILIVEHRFKKNIAENIRANGKYNVQFLIFRNDKNGLACLKWWRKKCLEWCYNRHQNGLIGDQGYLNDWPSLFRGVHVLKNLGGGLAPWNINNYHLVQKDDKVLVEQDQLIFYHYHSFRIYSRSIFDLAFGYSFTKDQKRLIYQPYLKAIQQAIDEVKEVEADFNYGFKEGLIQHLIISTIKSIKP
jgi:hypothetical protein